MKTHDEIEELGKVNANAAIVELLQDVRELLLDLRDQQAQLLAALTAQVENERDVILRNAGLKQV